MPDYASVNLSERDAPAVMDTLHGIGVGVEAGLATVADAERFAALPHRHRVFRVLIEVEEPDLQSALQSADDISTVLSRAGVRRPILLHGFETTVWPLVELACRRRWSARVGLEDGKYLPNGAIAPDNAALVATAVKIFREGRSVSA